MAKYESEVKEAIDNQLVDAEKVHMISMGNHVCVTAHSPNEAIMYILDPQDQQIKILTCLRVHKGFFRRLKIAIGYLFACWMPYNGDWNMFIFNKEDAERLIAFLRKVS